tara:strand:+ start:325 stop:966 length:642 start_codon:yes stop_codon:yes gene_type:complete
MIDLNKEKISIFIIWLFHLSGILGIIYGNSDWFVSVTPINLTISFILLILNTDLKLKVVLLIFFCFTIGMLAEILGVNYGLIFGNYKYGEVLGYKVLSVPIIIGVNWCILVLITGAMSNLFFKSYWNKVFCGIFLMLFMDVLIEPIAPILDFWNFEGGIAKFQNYLGWFFVSFPMLIVFHKLKPNVNNSYSFNLYFLQVLFFTILIIKNNTFI